MLPSQAPQNISAQSAGPQLATGAPLMNVPDAFKVLFRCREVRFSVGQDPYDNVSNWPVSPAEREAYFKALVFERQKWQRHGQVVDELAKFDQLLSAAAGGSSTNFEALRAAESAVNAISYYNRLKNGKFGIVPTRVGFDSFQLEGEVCSGECQHVPTLRYLQFSKKGITDPELRRFCMVVGVCCVLVSAPDQVNPNGLLVLQLRSPKFNFPYGGVAGAGIAGLLNVRVKSPGGSEVQRYLNELESVPETILPITNSLLFDHVMAEGREELGIVKGLFDMSKLGVMGLAEDLTSPHYEFLLKAELPFAFDRHADIGAHHSVKVLRERQHPHEFAENIVGIPPTPKNVLLLLSEGPPMPPTHAAAFAVWAYEHAKELLSERSAQTWLAEAQEGAISNLKRMGREVFNYYKAHPENYFCPVAQEEPALDGFLTTLKSSQEYDLARKILERDLTEESPIRMIWNFALEAVQQGRLSEGRLQDLAARGLAMHRGAIHTPDIHGYDPRRLPTMQGLRDQAEHILSMGDKFTGSGEFGEFNAGTLSRITAERFKCSF